MSSIQQGRPPGGTTRTIQIRAGEGGEDARRFVAELAGAYGRLCERRR